MAAAEGIFAPVASSSAESALAAVASESYGR